MKNRLMISVLALALLLGYSAQAAFAEGTAAAGTGKPKAKSAHSKKAAHDKKVKKA